MNKLQTLAGELLDNKEVSLIIGYQKGANNKTRAAFISTSEDSKNLIFDDTCKQNLAVYLSKKEINKFGKIAIVCQQTTLKSIIVLTSEYQLSENIFAIILDKENNWQCLKTVEEISNFSESNSQTNSTSLELIEKMTLEERWNYWQDQFSKCFKCYACRAACPLCYCDRCTVENNQPQWISIPSSKVGNLEWHIMRAMHLAGRCINCNACAEACPQGIPLNILTQKLTNDIFNDFKYTPGKSSTQTNVLSTFDVKDKENFIK